MYKIGFSLSIALTFLITSCQKNTVGIQTDKSDLQISISMQGGWCSGSDSLTFMGDKGIIAYRNSCKDDLKTEKFSLSKSDWNELTSLFDKEKFDAVNLDACGVCYDGTDYRVTVKQGFYSHSIRFDRLNNTKLDPIRPFIEKLLEIRSEYRVQFGN